MGRKPSFDDSIMWLSYTTRHMHPQLMKRMKHLSVQMGIPLEMVLIHALERGLEGMEEDEGRWSI